MKKNELRSMLWYTDDVGCLLSEMDNVMAGMWVKLLNKCVASDLSGVLVCSLEALAVCLGMKKEEAMPVLMHLAMRSRRIQVEKHGHSEPCYEQNFSSKTWLTGHIVVWVDGVEVNDDTARKLSEKLTGWEQIRVELPRKRRDELCSEADRVAWRKRQSAHRRISEETQGPNETQKGPNETLVTPEMAVTYPHVTPEMAVTLPKNGVTLNDVTETLPISNIQYPNTPPIPPPGELVLQAESECGEKSSKERPSGSRQKKLTAATCTPEMDRIGSWFGHRPGTGWTYADKEAWERMARGVVLSGDMEALEWYYTEAAKRHGRRNYAKMQADDFFPCRCMGALFGKWRAQVDRALARKEADSQERNRLPV